MSPQRAAILVLLGTSTACTGLTAPPEPEPVSVETTTAAAAPAPTPAPPPVPSAPPPATDANEKLKIVDTLVGKGPAAKAGDRLKMNYTGKLANGSEFDSSKNHGPFEFVLGRGQVIKGWDEGIVGMKPGGKRTLTIPSAMGYGPRGHPPKIPPNSTLVFDVELLGIEK